MSTKTLSDLLICPNCKIALINSACPKCRKEIKYTDGIYDFLNDAEVDNHVEGQINYFSKEEIVSNDRYALEPWQKRYVDLALENIADIKNKTVLDCGIGSGYMSIELAKLGASVICVDVTKHNLYRIKKISENMSISENMIYLCADLSNLPLQRKCVDLFVANAVLEHVEYEKAAAENISRTLTDTGKAMITVPLKYRYIFPILIPVHVVYDRLIGHLRRYDLKSLKRVFSNCRIGRIYYSGYPKRVLFEITRNILKRLGICIAASSLAETGTGPVWATNITVFIENKNEDENKN